MTSIKILLVDDHALVLDGLTHLLNLLGDVSVIATRNSSDVLPQIEAHPDLDLILLDLDLGTADVCGLRLLERIRRHTNTIPVVMLSAHDSPEDIREAFKLGARGFITKHADTQQLLNALQFVLSGGLYVPENVLDGASQTFAGETGLTTRQKDVLQLLAEGLPNKAIAQKLGLSEATVRVHLTSIFRCLGVKNRTEAALKACDKPTRLTTKLKPS